MAIFGGRDVSVDIVFDNEQFQDILKEVHGLVEEVAVALDKLEKAKKELEQARKDLDKSLAKLQQEKRRPVVIRNS